MVTVEEKTFYLNSLNFHAITNWMITNNKSFYNGNLQISKNKYLFRSTIKKDSYSVWNWDRKNLINYNNSFEKKVVDVCSKYSFTWLIKIKFAWDKMLVFFSARFLLRIKDFALWMFSINCYLLRRTFAMPRNAKFRSNEILGLIQIVLMENSQVWP